VGVSSERTRSVQSCDCAGVQRCYNELWIGNSVPISPGSTSNDNGTVADTGTTRLRRIARSRVLPNSSVAVGSAADGPGVEAATAANATEAVTVTKSATIRLVRGNRYVGGALARITGTSVAHSLESPVRWWRTR
jgi:hypothetical protein